MISDGPLEFTVSLADNLDMAITAKKVSVKHHKPVGKRPAKVQRPAMAKPVVSFDPIADAQECDKISRTLDVDAFITFHKSNTASQQYWQSKE